MSFVKILCLSAFLNCLTWIIIIPIWQYPDEQAHFAQVQNTALQNNNVSQQKNTSQEIEFSEIIFDTKRDEVGNNKFTYNPDYKIDYANSYDGLFEKSLKGLPNETQTNMVKQESTLNPPIYYFLASKAYLLTKNSSLIDRVYIVRLLSAILFTILIFVSYQISKIIFKNNYALQISLPTTLSTVPMFVYASTGILPDPMTNLLFAIAIYVSVLILEFGPRIKYLFFASIIFILAVFTRQQSIILIGVFATANFLYFVTHRKVMPIICTIILIITTVFLVYLKIIPIAEISYGSFIPDSNLITYFIWTMKHSYSEVLPWYWGVYKWLSLSMPHVFYELINRLLLVSLIGLFYKAYFFIKNKEKFTIQEIHLIFLVIISTLYFGVFALGDYYFNKQYGYSFGIQGRYFFPLIIAHFAIFLTGLWSITSLIAKYHKIIFSLIFPIFIFFNIWSQIYVAAHYYDTNSISQFITQVSQYKPDLIKGYLVVFLPIMFFIVQLYLLYIYIKNVKSYKINL